MSHLTKLEEIAMKSDVSNELKDLTINACKNLGLPEMPTNSHAHLWFEWKTRTETILKLRKARIILDVFNGV